MRVLLQLGMILALPSPPKNHWHMWSPWGLQYLVVEHRGRSVDKDCQEMAAHVKPMQVSMNETRMR